MKFVSDFNRWSANLYLYVEIPPAFIHRQWGNGGINAFVARLPIVNVRSEDLQVSWWGRDGNT